MSVEAFKIESRAEADAYLHGLVAVPAYRTMAEIEMRAHKYVGDADLRSYFITKGAELLRG